MKNEWKLLKWFGDSVDLIVFSFGFNLFVFGVCCVYAKLKIVFVIWGKFRLFLIKLRCVCFDLFFIILVCSRISDNILLIRKYYVIDRFNWKGWMEEWNDATVLGWKMFGIVFLCFGNLGAGGVA
jgi:hypothetical protein